MEPKSKRLREQVRDLDVGMLATYAWLLGLWLAVYLACGPVK